MRGDRKHCKRCARLEDCFAVCQRCLDAVDGMAVARAAKLEDVVAELRKIASDTEEDHTSGALCVLIEQIERGKA